MWIKKSHADNWIDPFSDKWTRKKSGCRIERIPLWFGINGASAYVTTREKNAAKFGNRINKIHLCALWIVIDFSIIFSERKIQIKRQTWNNFVWNFKMIILVWKFVLVLCLFFRNLYHTIIVQTIGKQDVSNIIKWACSFSFIINRF